MDGTAWSDFLFDGLDDWFQVAVEAGAYAVLLAGVVLLINVVFRRWLSAGQMGLLWALVLARLLMPVAPASPLGLANIFAENSGADSAPMSLQADANSSTLDLNRVPAYHNESNVSNLEARTRARGTPPREANSWFVAICLAIPYAWILIGGVGLAWTFTSYARFCRHVNRTAACDDARLLRLWQQSCATAGARRAGQILQFDGVAQPAIMGVYRPTLLLPTDFLELNDDQLRMIMLHELAHVRRWDIAMNWVLVLIRAIHWWNPVYWLAAARFRSLREQACDAFVVRRLDGRSSQGYGAMLLDLAARRPAVSVWRVMLPASILSFFPSLFPRRAIRRRLRSLRRATITYGRWHTASVAIVVVVLAVSGFTTATELEEPPMDLPAWMARHPDVVLASKRTYEVTEVFDGPKETREYDIAECLEQIRRGAGLMMIGAPPKQDAQQELELTLKLLFCQPVPSDNSDVTIYGAHRDKPQSKAAAKTGATESSPLTYTINGTTLKATAPAALHEKLRRTLDAWSKSGLAQIAVETRFLSADRDLISDLGVSWQFLEAFSQERESTFPTAGHDGALVVHAESRVDEYLPLVVSTLDKLQSAKLIEIARTNKRANMLNAPKVTIFNGQEAMIADVVQRPFVVGVFQQTSGANAPKTVVLDEGTKIKVRAVQSRDRKRVHLETSVDMRVLGDVTTASTSYRGQPVSIQVPSVNHKSIDVAADIEDGQTVLVGSIPTGKQKQYLYYLVSASRIPETK